MKLTKNMKSSKKNLVLFTGAGLLLGALGVMGLQVHAQQPFGQVANFQITPSINATSSVEVKDVKDVKDDKDIKDEVNKDNLQISDQAEGKDIPEVNDLIDNQQ